MRNDIAINVRLDINRFKNKTVIYARKGNTKSMTLHVTLANNGQLYDLSNIVFAEMLIKKPDDKEVMGTMSRVGNELLYTLKTQDVNVAGTSKAQIKLFFMDGASITAPEFDLEVFGEVLTPPVEESENVYDALEDIVVETSQYAQLTKDTYELIVPYAQRMEELKVSCEEAAETVKEYAEITETNANNAATSENNARESELNAAVYESKSKNFAEVSEANMTVGKGYLDEAKDYYARVGVYADTALSAADTAVEAIQDIDAYSVAAQHSAERSEAAKNTAQILYGAIEYKAAEAVQSIKDAVNSNLPQFNMSLEDGHLYAQNGKLNLSVVDGRLEWEIGV